MEKHEEVEIVLGISIIFVIVTSIFSLLNKLSSFIIFHDWDNYNMISNLKAYLYSNIVWIITVVIIILSLILYARKFDQKIFLNLLNNKIICISSGLLIIIEALSNLSSNLPIRIVSVTSAFQVTKTLGQAAAHGIIKQSIIAFIISIVIYVCQIILGICLIRFKNKKFD